MLYDSMGVEAMDAAIARREGRQERRLHRFGAACPAGHVTVTGYYHGGGITPHDGCPGAGIRDVSAILRSYGADPTDLTVGPTVMGESRHRVWGAYVPSSACWDDYAALSRPVWGGGAQVRGPDGVYWTVPGSVEPGDTLRALRAGTAYRCGP